MVRVIGFLVGLGFVFVAAWSLLWGAIAFTTQPREAAAHHGHDPKDVAFSFDGPFGKYDRQQLQRGFQVYKEVCASCHGLGFVAFRNLSEIGYSEAEVKAIAANWQIQVPDIDPKTGEPAGRKGLPSDAFPEPYPNEVAARAANNNAMPPDLSLITKARAGGAAYVYSLLTGYESADHAPADAKPGPGLHYNPYFPNLNIAMPPPIQSDGQVTYADGTNPTKDQIAKDVSAFLAWTAEPRLENRHRTGWAVLIFLILATILSYMAYQNVWRAAKRPGRPGDYVPPAGGTAGH